MRKVLCSLAILGLVAMTGVAQDLDGRKIEMESGDWMSLHVPLALPYDGPALAEDDRVVVTEGKTGKAFPATVRNGEFVFVPEGAMPKTTHAYTVSVGKDEAPMKVALKKIEGKDEVQVLIDGKHFTSYVYSNDNRKPFLWPVNAEGGVSITRDFPMGAKVETDDHPHHKSMYTAYGDLNGVDCWAEGENAGCQQSGDVQFGSGDAYGWVTAKNTWLGNDKKPVITESREYRFYATPEDKRMFDVAVTFTADYGDVLFKDTKEGGIMTLRIRDDLREAAGKGGVITNAEGLTGEKECWGKPSAWCDYSGPIEGIGVRGAAILDHPSNLRHPTCWHVRNYGLMAANCFGLGYFTEKDAERLNGDYTLKSGESFTFKYRVYVHSDDSKEAAVADRYADYATPPKVDWKAE